MSSLLLKDYPLEFESFLVSAAKIYIFFVTYKCFVKKMFRNTIFLF